MNDIALYANGTATNHGCEALTRSLFQILKNDYKITLCSNDPEEDKSYGLDDLINISPIKTNIHENKISYFFYALKQSIKESDKRYFRYLYRDFLHKISSDTLYLSIGGDNYAYGYSVWLYVLNEEITRRRGKIVLCGASIDSQIKDPKLILDLNRYSAIIARESITYKALKNAKIKVPLFMAPDPAFLLPPKYEEIPLNFIPGNTIGINISPLVIKKENKKGLLLQNYKRLIQYIIKETDMNIALIPHVIKNDSDDRVPLNVLYKEFQKTDRIMKIPDNNSCSLKGYISQCRFLIAARTHASIAAYSMNVPALVIGYSVKSQGIARDIFGEEEPYVMNVDSIQKEDDILRKFLWIYKNEDKIRMYYDSVMNNYKQQVLKIPNILRNI